MMRMWPNEYTDKSGELTLTLPVSSHSIVFGKFFAGFVFYNWYWYLIPLIPFIVYPFAWSGHYFFEKNEPAAFDNVIMAKISDWIMFKDIILGRLKIW